MSNITVCHAEEILIHSAFTRAVRPAVRRPIACAFAGALAGITLIAAPLAYADEFDWVYFPMYPNDTAHAVHLSSLKFRPDGLLTAATRYPRTSGEPWTEQESKAGWYSYDERLIDCETGFFVETATSLLAHDGTRLATRAKQHDQQVSRLEMQLQESAAKRWPHHSDIFLACAAASNPAFKKQRAAQAAKVQPLFSDTSIVEALSADNAPLLALARMRYDFSRIEKRPAALASDLFDEMRAQYLAWRKAINGAHVPGRAASGDDSVRADANRQLHEAGVQHLTIRSIEGAVIEHTYPGTVSRSAGAMAGTWLESARTDCEYGISVPFAIQKIARDKKPRPSTPLRARSVLPDIRERYAENPYREADGPFGGFFLDPDAAALCQLVAGIRNPSPTAAPDADTALAYGIEPGALAQQATPAAMLLAIRTAHRRYAR